MTGLLWSVLGVLGGIGIAALGDMVSEEVRDRLDHLPRAILSLAARRLDAAQRVDIYEQVWLPDLAYLLKGDEARPVTRLVHGTRFALGILVRARRIAGYLGAILTPGPLEVAGLLNLRLQSLGANGIGIGDEIRVGDGPKYLVVGAVADGSAIVRRVSDGKPGSDDFPPSLLKPLKIYDGPLAR